MKILFLIFTFALHLQSSAWATNEEIMDRALRFGQVDVVKKLIDNGFNINQKVDGRYPLERAVSNSDVKLTELLLKSGALVNQKNDLGATPLISASGMFGRLSIVKLLVENGADIHVEDQFGETALSIASVNENSSIVKYLIQKGAKAFNTNCESVLSKASRSGMLGNVRILVSHFENIINYKDKKGRTALMESAGGGSYSTYNYLLSKKADLTVKDLDQNNLLIESVIGNNYYIVKNLLERGFDPNYKNKFGQTALLKAIFSNNFAMVKLLISKGADVNTIGATDLDNPLLSSLFGIGADPRIMYLLARKASVELRKKALITAFHHNNLIAAKILFSLLPSNVHQEFYKQAVLISATHGHLSMLKYFAKNKNILNSTDSNGKTPLMLATENGNIETFKYLLARRVNLEAKDSTGNNAAIWAVKKNRANFLILLKKSGVNLNLTNQKGETLLMQAVSKFDSYYDRSKVKESVLYLIQENNINAQDNDGETALMKAIRSQNEWLVRLLIESCASLSIENKSYLKAQSIAHHYAPTMSEHLYPAKNPQCNREKTIAKASSSF